MFDNLLYFMMGNISKLEKKKFVPLGNCVANLEGNLQEAPWPSPYLRWVEVSPFQTLLKPPKKTKCCKFHAFTGIYILLVKRQSSVVAASNESDQESEDYVR